MKHRHFFAILFPLAVLVAMMLPAAAGPGAPVQSDSSISGYVIDAASGAPISKAQVQLFIRVPVANPASANPTSGPTLYTVRKVSAESTSTDGRFNFSKLDHDHYRVEVSAPGYVSQVFGHPFAGIRGGLSARETPIDLVPANALVKDIEVRLVRPGVVTGQISDRTLGPLAGIDVIALTVAFDDDGEPSKQVAGRASTDDRGNFRLFDLPPGRFLITAGSTDPKGGNVTRYLALRKKYQWTFYPGTAREFEASVIDVVAGAEIPKVNFALAQTGPTFTVDGTVVDSTSGMPLPMATVVMQLCAANGQSTSPGDGLSSAAKYDSATGHFNMSGLSSGQYLMYVDPGIQNRADPITAHFVVDDRNVTDLTLAVPNGRMLAGRVIVESAGPGLDWSRVRIQLRHLNRCSGAQPILRGSSVGSDGQFTIDKIAPDMYRAVVSGLPDDFYVKSVRYNNKVQTGDRVAVGSNELGKLEVVVSSRGAAISALILDGKGRPDGSAQVALIPDERDRKDLYRTATADSLGRVNLRGVAPGDYRLFGWETVEPNAFFSKDFLQPVESHGISLRISESSNTELELTEIPVR